MIVAAAAGAGVLAGFILAFWWMHRDAAGKAAWCEARRVRRRDRVREAVALARDNLAALDEDRALKWARRAVRLDGCSPEAHAAMGSCRQAVEHYGQALVHHRRAEHLGGKGLWRVENAVDAATVCLRLREEACSEAESQVLWDEAHAWMRLAHELDPDEAGDVVARSPWLASLNSGEVWLRP